MGEGGGCSPEIWVEVCGPLLETLALFQTNICHFPFPFSDLTRNLIPYFRPNPYPISLLKHLRTSLNSQRQSNRTSQRKKINNKVASSKNCTHFQIRVHIPYPISDQNGSKTIPFGATYLHGLYNLREPPLPPGFWASLFVSFLWSKFMICYLELPWYLFSYSGKE